MEFKLYSKNVSVIKSLTWRVIASLDTLLIAYFFTNSISLALSISSLEILSKTILFYYHERLWLQLHQRVHFFANKKNHTTSLAKALSWRFFGSLDTLIISFFITQSANTAFLISVTEMISKTIFYFFHERFWIWLIERINAKPSELNFFKLKQLNLK